MTQPPSSLYLLYHEIRTSRTDYSYALQATEFEKHIELIAELRKKGGPGLKPEITFDDGHISNFEFALPILASRAVKAHFFITVGWTNQRSNYMGWHQLRALHQAGQTIGSHGWTHALLTHCSAQQLGKELLDPRLALEDKLGTSITTMSLPGGRYNKRILAACREAGYTQVFTSVPRAEPQPYGYTVGRLNIRGDWTRDWIENLLAPKSNVLTNLERQYHVKSIAMSLLGDRLYEKLWARFNRQELDTPREGAAANEDPAHH